MRAIANALVRPSEATSVTAISTPEGESLLLRYEGDMACRRPRSTFTPKARQRRPYGFRALEQRYDVMLRFAPDASERASMRPA
jgi:hypothetical protein